MSDSESSVELPVQTKEKKATKPSLLSALREKRVALESDQREAAAAAKGLKEKTAKPPKREVEKPVKKTASDKIVAAAKEPEPESEPDVERAESAHNARRSIETVVVKKEKKPKKIVYIEEESSEEEEVIVRRPKKKEATQPQHRPLAAAILRSHSPTKKRMPPPQKVQAAPVALTGYNLLDNLLFSGR